MRRVLKRTRSAILSSLVFVAVALGAVTPEASQGASSGAFADIRLQARSVEGTVLVLSDAHSGARYANLEAALAAAGDGDTLLLSDGLFRGPENRGLVVTGRNLTIRSENGPQATVVDCELQGYAICFDGPLVTADTIVEGVTFRRGVGVRGGGIECMGSACPTIENCLFVDNRANDGAGVYYRGSTGSPGLIRQCIFRRNIAVGDGGGLYVVGAQVENCFFEDNTAGSGGGAYAFVGASISGSLFQGNSAGTGGALALNALVPIDNCTLVGNHASQAGGGAGLGVDLPVSVANTIFWGNTASQFGSQATYVVFFPGSDPIFDHCLIENGVDGVEAFELGGAASPIFIGLLDEDPQFVDDEGADYRLQPTSPAIDSGALSAALPCGAADIEGQPRLSGGRVDVGMDEYWGGLVHNVVRPGRAGWLNAVTVTGADPGALVHFFSGSQYGSLSIGFGACPGLALAIADATLLGVIPADAMGAARLEQCVPVGLIGSLVLNQAVTLALNGSGLECEVSNRTEFKFL